MPTPTLVPERADAMAIRDGGALHRLEGLVDGLVERAPVPERWRRTVATMGRSMCVSIGTTILSTSVLVVLAVVLGVDAGVSNVVASLCGIGPSYVYNRRWAWRRDGSGSLWREAVPFWVLSVVGLVVSTVAVSRVAEVTASWPPSARAVVLPLANLAVFGSLWLVQFVLLDRFLFRPRAEVTPASRRPVPPTGG